jgi:hypothetical protein
MYPDATRHRLLTTAGLTSAALAIAAAAALPALASPPGGQGNQGHGNPGHGNSGNPPGQAKKTASPAPTSTASPAGSPTPTSTHVPPGQAKKAAGGNGNGKGKGHGNGNGANGPGNGKGKGHAGTMGHNPPGNNGTVKIHGTPGDPSHANDPKIGCAPFYVDFWGFDQGQTLTVSFVGQAPTGKGTPLSFTAPNGTSITSPDSAGGGNDPDGELEFDPTASSLSVLGAPAHQGYHVRLIVSTGQGGGYKYKVFWIAACTTAAAAPAAPTVTSTTTPTATPTTTPTVASTTSPTLTSTHTGVVTPHRQLLSDTKVVPEVKAGAGDSAPVLQALPFTGSEIANMVWAGLTVLGLGTALTVAARRRRRAGIG